MTRDIRFDGKVALVTGAGHGIGRGYAMLLASRGAKVVVNDLGTAPDGRGASEAPAQKVVDEIRAADGEAVADFGDVSDRDSASAMVRRAVDAFGGLDVLVASAGILRDRTFLKMPLDDFEHVVRVHLFGTVYVAKAALPLMAERKYGRMVFATSVSGLYGNFGQTNYAAAKMGIVGFMNALKLEALKHNVLVNTIAPLAESRLGAGVFTDEQMRILRPELVTATVGFLASDQCRTTGGIISAGAGHYAEAQMRQAPGVRFAPETPVTPEMIAARFGDITDMTHNLGFPDSGAAVREITGLFESQARTL
jgi:NAD(P)-dependent dehydrogenase (short-subunit alcohol dehydrogenase family)